MRQRNIALISLIVLLVPLLSGCGTPTTADGKPTGFFGTFFVKPISDLLDWFYPILGNYVWSILLMTLLIRIIVFPLTWKQQKSAIKMKELQPQIKRIQKKYGNKKDPNSQQKLQQELMKLYQENNINPLSGCFPLLIQIPILFALYEAIRLNQAIQTHQFLYLKLGSPDPYYILAFLAAVTTYLTFATSMANQEITDGPNPMKAMAWFMPIMVLVMAIRLPSAMILYWIFGNILSILQQAFIINPYKNRKEAQRGATR